MNLFGLLGSRFRRRGSKFLLDEQWELAAAEFRKSIARTPHCLESLQGLGIALLKQELWGDAEVALETAAANCPDPPASLHAQLGMARIQLSRWPDALTAITRATEIEPSNAEYHGLRGTALLQLERWQEAVDTFDTAIECNAEDFSFYQGQAQALFELGRYEETVAAASRCIELKSDVASTYVRLGAALLKLWRDDDAVPALQQAVKIDPSLTEVHEMLAHTYVRLGENEQAIESFQRMVQLDPSAKTRIAVPLSELGFVDEQDITELRAKIESDPDCYDSLVQLASLLAIKQNWDETIETAQRALTLQPEGRVCRKLMGDAYLAQEKYEPALECFRGALQEFSEYNFIGDDDELSLIRKCYHGLGRALKKLDRVEESLEVYQRQLNLTFDPVTCLEIGREFQQLGQDDLATRSFVRAIVMNYNHLDAYKVLGDHLEKTGRRDEALVVYTEVNAMGLVDDDLRTRLAKSKERATRID